MNIKVRDLHYIINQTEGTYFKVIWDLFDKIFNKYGTYLGKVWVLLEENEVLKRLNVNTVKGLADLVPLLIDLNRYKYNRKQYTFLTKRCCFMIFLKDFFHSKFNISSFRTTFNIFIQLNRNKFLELIEPSDVFENRGSSLKPLIKYQNEHFTIK